METLRPWAARIGTLSTVLLVAGCATSGTRGTSDRDVITQQMIQRSSASTVLQLVQRERPSWLGGRGGMTARTSDEGIEQVPIIVYLDNSRYGTPSDLGSLSTHGITQLRRLSAAEATQRFGTGHPRGAILVSTDPPG